MPRRMVAQGRGTLEITIGKEGRIEFINVCYDSPDSTLIISGDFGGSRGELRISPKYLLERGMLIPQQVGFSVSLTRYDDQERIYCVDVRNLDFNHISIKSPLGDYIYSIVVFRER